MEQSSEEEEPESNELITEKAIEEMSNEITKALALQHPIMYETYNICEIVGQCRLAKFPIRTLQKHLCSLRTGCSIDDWQAQASVYGNY